MHFGDLDDPNSNVSRLLQEQKSFRMHAELGTEPGFHYLYGKANDAQPDAAAPAAITALTAGELRTRGVEPALQQHWDWKASANFICGGMGSGLFIFTTAIGLRHPQLLPLGWLALAIMALGLATLMLKIGKPLRALYVLRQPRRSWMTREAWIAAVMFPLAALALWLASPSLLILSAVLAFGFLFCQGMIMKSATGIPVWRSVWVLPLLLGTGFAEGGGLFLAAIVQFPALAPLADAIAIAVAALVLLRAWVWRSYLTALVIEGAPTPRADGAGCLSAVAVVRRAGAALGADRRRPGAAAGQAALRAGRACRHGGRRRPEIRAGDARQLQSRFRAGAYAGARFRPGRSGGQAGLVDALINKMKRGDTMPKPAANKERSAFMFDPDAECMPREALTALQTTRLQQTLERAYNDVPHYRKKFDAAKVKPSDFKSLADITRFPFTVKSDLRDNYPFGMFAVPREQLLRVHASSGTTGKPTVVGYTQRDLDTWSDLMARCFACAGALPGQIVHNAYGYGLFTGGLGAHYGAERLGCTVVPISGGGTERQVTLINDFKADVLCATPSYALNIAEVGQQMGVDISKSSLKVGLFGAEPWSDAMRADLEERLGLKAIDVYGLSEILGPGVACECAAMQSGLHGWEDHFLFETIDPETMQPVPNGEPGELVITTLTKEALPMIRYRTRDITRLNHEPCACGRTHVRIMRVTGRNDDMMIIRGVNVYPSQVESVLVGFPGLTPHYQIVLTREGALDAMAVEVELAPDFAGDPKSKAKEVVHHIKSLIGVTCTVTPKAPGEVPRSQGKAVRVKDQRQKKD